MEFLEIKRIAQPFLSLLAQELEFQGSHMVAQVIGGACNYGVVDLGYGIVAQIYDPGTQKLAGLFQPPAVKVDVQVTEGVEGQGGGGVAGQEFLKLR